MAHPVQRLLKVFVTLLVCSSWFAHGPTLAQESAGPPVEFAVWNRVLSGTLGTKAVSVTLSRVAGNVSGSYCYAPCSEKTRQQLALTGTIEGNALELTERDTQSKTPGATGRWTLKLDGDGFDGHWTAPDRKKTFAVRLRDTQPSPVELRLVAEAMPEPPGECGSPPHVSAIRIYRQGRLAQELPTDSQGTCDVFTPSFVDANFDGYPDLTIALTLPAGPNIPHQTWLYDPATRRYVDAPAALQDVTSPEFDKTSKTIVSYWRNGCCEHGVTLYRWHGKELEEADTASSTQLPVLVGKKVLYCYVTPVYRNGRIEFPERVEQVGERLALTFADFSGCEAERLPMASQDVTIWKRGAHGELLAVRTESTQTKAVDTTAGRRYCPETPYFANGQIKRAVLVEHPEEECSDTPP